MRRLVYGSFFLMCIALIGYSKHTYIQGQHAKASEVFGLLKNQVQGDPLNPDNQEKIKTTLMQYPESVYMLLQDPISQSGWGYVNAVSFEHGAYPIEQKLHAEGTVPTFDWMTQMGAKSEFVDVSVFQWSEQTLNMYYGYLSPKHRFVWNTRQRVAQAGFYAWLVLGSLLSFLYFFSPARAWRKNEVIPADVDQNFEDEVMDQVYAKAVQQSHQQSDFSEVQEVAPAPMVPDQVSGQNENSVDKAEAVESSTPVDPVEKVEPEETNDPIVAMLTDAEEDDTSVDDIPKQIWLRLLDEANTHEWEIKGSLYVRETKKGIQSVLFPWGTSMVTRREVIFPTYLFEVEGRVMSGEEGFVVLFRVGEYFLTWVLGGWKNTRCEVVGYESTRTTHPIEPKKWHHVRIEKDKDEVIGYIDGRTAWQLPLENVTQSSPDLGFLEGLGVGVWSTSTKFRNIRVLKI